MSNRLRQLLILLAVLATISVNALANALPINGVTTAEVSGSFDTLFVPAGYVFSIWGLIYLGLLAYAIYQALPVQLENRRLHAIAGPFLIASVANIAWIFLWHYMIFPLTLVAMLALLISLIIIYQRLRRDHPDISAGERWLVRRPFSIYLGWISVATIANVQDVLHYLGWRGFGLSDLTWAIIMLLVGLGIAVLITWRERDWAFVLVLVWAYVGIAVEQAETVPLSTAATVLAIVLSLMAGASLLLRVGNNRLNPTVAA